MSNFELIDDYLTGKLNPQDKKSFEQQLVNDPELKSEVELQKEIIGSLKAARAAELKAMLNKVVITSPTVYLSPLRIAAGLVGAATLVTALYFYFNTEHRLDPNQMSSSLVDSIRQSEQIKTESALTDSVNNNALKEPVRDEGASPAKTHRITSPVSKAQNGIKPAIDLLDPSDVLSEGENPIDHTPDSNTALAIAKIEVSVMSDDRKHKAHYSFNNGKLFLYGEFNKELYEIIEVNGEKSRSLFLTYKSSFYQLDESRQQITELKEITDPNLIEKLRKFRSK